MPAGPQAVIVPLPAEGIAAGASLSAIDTAGRVTRVTAGAPSKLPYGCDQHQLDVVALAGDRSSHERYLCGRRAWRGGRAYRRAL